MPLLPNKRCAYCGYTFAICYFGLKYPGRTLRNSYCYVCQAEYSREHYRKNAARYKARVAVNNRLTTRNNRARLHEYLRTNRCVDCGTDDFAALEFDHRDPSNKRADIAYLVRQAVSWSSIQKEIDKCELVCANCHRKRTARQFRWRRLFGVEELVLPELPKRGTPGYEGVKSTRSRLARRHRNRIRIYSYLRDHACALCGESDPVVLDFDHLGEKCRDVTVIAAFGGLSDLLAEIAKCRVLCANCHRRETARAAGRPR